MALLGPLFALSKQMALEEKGRAGSLGRDEAPSSQALLGMSDLQSWSRALGSLGSPGSPSPVAKQEFSWSNKVISFPLGLLGLVGMRFGAWARSSLWRPCQRGVQGHTLLSIPSHPSARSPSCLWGRLVMLLSSFWDKCQKSCPSRRGKGPVPHPRASGGQEAAATPTWEQCCWQDGAAYLISGNQHGQWEQNPSWHILLCLSGGFTDERAHRNLWKPVGMLCCSLRTGFCPGVLQSLFCLSLSFSPVLSESLLHTLFSLRTGDICCCQAQSRQGLLWGTLLIAQMGTADILQ